MKINSFLVSKTNKFLALLLVLVLIVGATVPLLADNNDDEAYDEEYEEYQEYEYDEDTHDNDEDEDIDEAEDINEDDEYEEEEPEPLRGLPPFAFQFEVVAEDDYATLKLDRRNNNVRRVCRATGEYMDTLVLNGVGGSTHTREQQRTDFSINFLRDRYDAVGRNLNSFVDSVDRNQVEYTLIPGGVRATFMVGDPDALVASMFPRYISAERMEYFVLQHLPENLRDTFLEQDYWFNFDLGNFRRRHDTVDDYGEPRTLSMPTLRRMYRVFFEYGTYTLEELEYDTMYWAYENPFEPPTLVSLVIEYTLDNGDLLVVVPRDGWGFVETQPFRRIILHPYLMAGSVYDEGSILLPDGGVIQFNNGSREMINIPMFGIDPQQQNFSYSEPFDQATLPIFGMIRNNHAILAIIEEGAPVATLHACTSDRVEGEFNRAFVSFDMIFQQGVHMRGGGAGMARSFSFDDVYNMDIRMRYVFLTGEDATHLGMARAYQNFLLERGLLATNPIPYDLPMHVEFIATTILRTVRFGIPRTIHEPMTSTADAERILRTMRDDMGIPNVIAQYTHWNSSGGMASGRMDNTGVLRSIGGNRGMRSLLEAVDELGFELFPSARTISFVEPTTAFGRFGRINESMMARSINHQFVWLGWFQIHTRGWSGAAPALSPHYWNSYNQRIVDNFQSLGFRNISSTDMGRYLFGHNSTRGRHDVVSRVDAVDFATETFATLSDNMGLMLNNPNAYAFAYANVITSLPFGLGNRRIVDFYIPLVQMVLENHIPFSMPAFNIDPMDWRGFDEYLLRAVESRSAPKLILTQEHEGMFVQTLYFYWFLNHMFFQTQFSRWENRLGEYYARLNEFHHIVRNAYMTAHRVYNGGNHVIVEYSNGVTVYINYGRAPWEVDGLVIDVLDFRVVQ